jgi:hypothetical protein
MVEIAISKKKLPNKACTRRWGFWRDSKHFLRLSIFPVGRRSAARPSAGNANRWQELAVNLSSSFKN